MKVSLHRIRFKIPVNLFLIFIITTKVFKSFQSSLIQMKASHALIRLRNFILVYSLPFLLLQLFHYSVWVISESNYEKSLIPGKDSLWSIHDFCQNHLLFWKSYLWIPDERLKWYGIEPLEETDAKKFDDMYGNDCKCEFKCEFKCTCGWIENITLNEHKSFQDFRIVSKPGILG